MNVYYSLTLVCFLALLAVILIRYVNLTVDQEFRRLAQASSDGEFRSSELKRADSLLAGLLPLPETVRPLPGPSSVGWNSLPLVLMGVGVILLWGGGSARRERELWFIGAAAAMTVSAVIMLTGLRKRKRERTARLLRFRADLRRMDGNRKAAAEDLTQLLRLTPWDDAAWGELADDLAAEGRLGDALPAAAEAARLDPEYDEYHLLEASLAIRLGRFDQARAAVAQWKERSGVSEDDPRAGFYQAAVELAEGRQPQAAESLRRILLGRGAEECEYLDTDQALAGVRELLLGRPEEKK